MINLRYHIVSITAVFLALGIGLVFGSSFIDAATVEGLRDNLEAIEGQNDALRDENTHLRQQIDAFEDDQDALTQELAQLVDGRLAGVPVVVLTVEGVDPDTVQSTADAIAAAGADLGGVLRLTERLALDDDAEVTDLADVLQLGVDDPARLRASLARRLGTELATAAAPVVPDGPVDPAATDTTPADDTATTDPGGATTTTVAGGGVATPEPELLAALRGAGFVELDAPAEAPEGFVVVPAAGLRLVVVAGGGSVLGDGDLLDALVERVAADVVEGQPGPVVVAAQRGPEPGADLPDGTDPDAERVAFVGPLRDSDTLRGRLSTVDHLERFSGLLATVLAVEHGGAGQRGHYGVGPGAQGLVPPPLTPEGG